MPDPEPLHPDELTWAALLAHWVEFARSALALPESGQSGLLRKSVPDIIQLQAVWFALQHLDELDTDQRALGIARAELLIDRCERAIIDRFGEELPKVIAELIYDARQAHDRVNKNTNI